MNGKNMRNCLFISLVAIILSGCATWNRTFFSRDLAMLSVGMTKQQVIQQLNTPQEIVMARQTEHGLLEVFEYVEKPFYYGRLNKAYWTAYWVYFLDGKLSGYERAEAVNAQKRLDRLEQLATVEALKGTALMPLQQNIQVDGTINHNVQGTILQDVNVR